MGKKFDRIFYGKYYMKEKTDKGRLAQLKISYFFVLFLFFVLVALSTIMLILLSPPVTLAIVDSDLQVIETEGNETVLDLIDLEEEEKEFVVEALDGLKTRYLRGQKLIKFTHDLEQYWTAPRPFRGSTRGFNKGGENYIKYSDNKRALRVTTCHELLHTYTYGGEITHKIVYDLAEQEVCFLKRGLFHR